MAIRKIALLAAVALVPAFASAAQVVQPMNFGPVAAGSNVNLVFNKFDPSLGTLNFINIKADLSVTGGTLGVDNEANQSAIGDAVFGTSLQPTSVDVTIAPPVGPVVITSNLPFELDVDDGDASDPNVYDPSGPDWDTQNAGAGSDSANGNVNSTFWAGYTGAVGTYTIVADTNQELNLAALGGVSYSITPQSASGTITVTYDYSIPEPVSMGVIGLSGLFLLRRKRTA